VGGEKRPERPAQGGGLHLEGPEQRGGLRHAELRHAGAGLAGSAVHPALSCHTKRFTARLRAVVRCRAARHRLRHRSSPGRTRRRLPARWSLAAFSRLAE